jgi:serine/threonine protein kinase
MPLTPGTRLGSYEVIALIGEGGMGQVYRARDSRLGRDVAIKTLPAALVADDDRRRRFVQEAKAASALNHPNILTIYEVGDADGVSFLATELIDGRTLRARLGSGRLALKEALDLAMQASAGLSAAHAAGIVHRDIKPENVMVRHDGYLKILDFGLAKLTETAPAEDADAATTMAVKTSPGVVMGTARYMSPEQARGLPVDARSDIFSLGAVMYEMLAGRPAFDGETANHVVVSVLEHEPPPLSELVPDTPPELERIVSKALAKDVDERYQTTRDLAVDLKRLKQRLEIDTDRARSISTPPQGVVPATTRARGRRIWIAVALGTVVLAAGVAFGLSRWRTPQSAPALRFDQMTVTKLTNAGTATSTAISPDGRYVVYVANENGQRSLWIRQVATGSSVQIAPPSNAAFSGVTFSPDGNFLYYTKAEAGALPSVYQTPVLGGPSQKILENVAGPVSFAPDGRQMAFRRATGSAANIMVANADGTGAHEIARVPAPDFLSDQSWSPDGAVIAVAHQSLAGGYHGSVFFVPASGGAREPMAHRVWYAVRAVRWLSPTRLAVIAADRDHFPDAYQVWIVSYPDGAVTRLTNDVNNHATLGTTADGQSVVTIETETASTLWVSHVGDPGRGEQVTTGMTKRDGYGGLSWTRDGKLISSDGRANGGLWLFDAGGAASRPLVVTNGLTNDPSACGDGAHVVFASDRNGAPHIWRADADGSNVRQITDSAGGETQSACSPDGRWVVYLQVTDRFILKRVAIDGRDPIELTHGPNDRDAAISPDGRWIAYRAAGNAGTSGERIIVMPSSGGAPSKTFDVPPDARFGNETSGSGLSWTADGAALTYIRTANGVDNLWIQPLSGGSPRPLTPFPSGRIFAHAWSRDGRLALARGSTASDVVLITLGKNRQ